MKNFETNDSFIFSLIIEDLDETISLENKVILEQWRNNDPANEQVYQEFLGVQINLDKLVERQHIDAQYSWDILDQKLDQEDHRLNDPIPITPLVKRKSPPLFWMKIAAMILVLSTLGYGYFFWKNKDIVVNTGTAVLTNIVLPDGTDLKLNAGTTISYSRNNFLADRKLVLEKGEAFIQVAPNSSSRFRVALGAVEAKDIGTRFNIRRTDSQSVVIVEEGQVEFRLYDTDQKVNLTAGKQGLYDAQHKTLTALDNPDLNYKAWIDRNFTFTAVPLQEVVKKLEEVYQAKIEVVGQGLKDRKLTAKLKYQELDSALSVVAESLDCKLSQANGKFVLSVN